VLQQVQASQEQVEASEEQGKLLRNEAAQLRLRAQSLASAHEQMREKLAQSADGLSESMREGRQSRRQLDEASLTIMQMDAKIGLLSSVTAQSEEKVDIRIARERVMMHEALDRMRAHMSEVLDAQRRDGARELKVLREDMTHQVLTIQIAKERADDSLAQILGSEEGRQDTQHHQTHFDGQDGGRAMAQTTQARHTREASEPNQGLQQAGHVQPLLAQAQELAHVRVQLQRSLQQQQALADFWSLEKQRFEAMELHLIEQARQHKTVASGRLVDSGADDWNAIEEASPYLTVHKAGAGIAQTQASQHLATVQQLGSAQLPSRPASHVPGREWST